MVLGELLKTHSVNSATDDIKFHGSFLSGSSVRGAVAQWFVRQTPDRAFRVTDQARVSELRY